MNLPVPYKYTFWQPWLKGWNGQFTLGNNEGEYGPFVYAWVDQELKKEMGY